VSGTGFGIRDLPRFDGLHYSVVKLLGRHIKVLEQSAPAGNNFGCGRHFFFFLLRGI
jgi:hypothetical protein